MTIIITINTDNAAFDGQDDGRSMYEVARILANLRHAALRGDLPERIRDANGNTCGTVTVTEDE